MEGMELWGRFKVSQYHGPPQLIKPHLQFSSHFKLIKDTLGTNISLSLIERLYFSWKLKTIGKAIFEGINLSLIGSCWYSVKIAKSTSC